MKNRLFGFLIVLMSATATQAAVPVSVMSFKNTVGDLVCEQDWFWWRDHLGTAFQDMLLTELAKNEQIALLERENIQDLNDLEVDLVNSTHSTHEIEKGHFTKAKYTIAGAVTGYEYCADNKKTNVNVAAIAGFLGIDGDAGTVADTINNVRIAKAHAKVIIDLRVIETRTGRIIKTITAEGKAERSNFKIDSELASYQDAKETPVGEAARLAIQKASVQIGPAIVSRR
jgi:curli biogenesis system outer membrane secretion channel CsgG